MYCQKCGAKLKDDLYFCPKCGARTIAGTKEVQQAPEKKPVKKKKFNKKPVIIAAVAAVAAAVAGRLKGNWTVWGSVAAVAAFIAIIALRVLFFQLGVSVFNFYGITG